MGSISTCQAHILSLDLNNGPVANFDSPSMRDEGKIKAQFMENDPFANINSPSPYTAENFYGIMIDTVASQKSTENNTQ